MDDLLKELAEVQRLQVLVEEPEGSSRRREFLLRLAAVMDRLIRTYPEAPDFEAWAIRYASNLLKYDRKHGTSQGPVGPDDPRWKDGVRDYVRQEYDTWVLGGDGPRPQHS
jgi:hypothetical protein